MPRLRVAEPPRLLRSVAIEAGALCAVAILAGVPWVSRHAAKAPDPAPKPVQQHKEQRIRVIRIPRPEPVRMETPKPPPRPKEPQRATPNPPPPRVAPPPPRMAPPKEMQAAARPQPAPVARPARQPVQIAPDVTAVQGVRIRTYVPASPVELAAHLRNTGGCLVVANLGPEGGDFVTSLEIEGSRAVETSDPLCSGAPKTLVDPALNARLGDPLGRVRAEYGPGNYVLEAILTPRLYDRAHAALVARFGPVSEEEMGRRAAESGYELKCYAEEDGPRCE
jgi:hypothetical protein